MSGRRTAGPIVTAALALSGCSTGNDDGADGPSAWSWTELGGPNAEVSPRAAESYPVQATASALAVVGCG